MPIWCWAPCSTSTWATSACESSPRGLGACVPGETGAALLGELELDLAPARELLAGVRLSVLHDVDVPLCGPDGAAVLFGPQKGLRPQDVALFDRALERLGQAFGGDV